MTHDNNGHKWETLYIGGDTPSFDSWNPDTDPEQFKELWNKLPTHFAISLMRRFGVEKNLQRYGDIILNNFPKVCQAVVDVIKEKYNGG